MDRLLSSSLPWHVEGMTPQALSDKERAEAANRGHIEDAVDELAQVTVQSQTVIEQRLDTIEQKIVSIEETVATSVDLKNLEQRLDLRVNGLEKKLDDVLEAVNSIGQRTGDLQDRVVALETQR